MAGMKKKLVEKFACTCQTLKFLPCKTDGRMNPTHYIYPYDTDMDQKLIHL